MMRSCLLTIILCLWIFSNPRAGVTVPFDFNRITRDLSIEEQLADPQVAQLLESYLHTRVTENNGAQVLVNGGQAFAQKISLIRSARETIYLQNMILMDDPTGLRLIYEMLQAVKRGVVVRIILDGTASWSGHRDFLSDLDSTIRSHYLGLRFLYPRLASELEDTSRSVSVYKSTKSSKGFFPVVAHDEERGLLIVPERGTPFSHGFTELMNPHKYLGVMHDKLLVVDGHSGITGGMNIADNYSHTGKGSGKLFQFSADEVAVLKNALPRYWKKITKQWGPKLDLNHYDERKGWRDTAVHVTGDVAVDMEASFLKHWHRSMAYYPDADARSKMSKFFSLKQSKFEPKTSQDFPMEYVPGGVSVTGVKAMAVGQIPLEGEIYYTRFMRWAINSAKKEINCQTPYAVYSKWMKDWLLKARERGVKVTLFTNSILSNDVGSPITWLARKSYAGLVKKGIKVVEWQGPTLHSKLCTVDGYMTLVGSNNNDVVGAYNSSEFGVVVFDKALGEFVSKVLDEDLRHSAQVTPEQIKEWQKTRFFKQSGAWPKLDNEWITFKLLRDQVYGKLEDKVGDYLRQGIYGH